MGDAMASIIDCANYAARRGGQRIHVHYQRTEMARSNILRHFEDGSDDESDVCVMLDCDHMHPQNIIMHLAEQCDAEHEIVGALAYRRGQPHDPCFYSENEGGEGWIVGSTSPMTGGLMPCYVVGTGAIAIRRSVITKLRAAGLHWPWFRYVYRDEDVTQRSEDFQFGAMCAAVGIRSWVDTGMITPHIGQKMVDGSQWVENMALAVSDPAEFQKRAGLVRIVKMEAA